MKNKYCQVILILLIITLFTPQLIKANEYIGHTEEDTVKVYDEDGNYIFATAMGVNTNDRYISQHNIEYVIEKVNGNRAIARKVGKVDLGEEIDVKMGAITPLAQEGKKLIAIYHTHNGESYQPGPTTEQGPGEIHNIGRTLKNALEKKGIKVLQSDNMHLPHDGAAYERSRATAVELVKNRPDAIFDIHRDAIPREEEYLKKVDGKLISQIRVVVGRQNPNRSVNTRFAKQLKAVSDRIHPGLIRDIFLGSGAYNQQISPRALLLEFGTHVTTKDQAEISAVFLADTINQLLYGAGNQVDTTQGENRNAYSTLFWVLLLVIGGFLTFLYLNEGSWEGVKSRIKNFFSREILDQGDKE